MAIYYRLDYHSAHYLLFPDFLYVPAQSNDQVILHNPTMSFSAVAETNYIMKGNLSLWKDA